MESEIKQLVTHWRPNVISYIKQKDKLMNPDKYEDSVPTQQSSSINRNLFDDFSDNEDQEDSSASGSDSSDKSPIYRPNKNRQQSVSFGPPDSSFEVSLEQQIQVPKLSNAQIRDNMINDEINRYANFSKTEFSNFCSKRGLTRADPLKFEPVGAIAWEYWRLKKDEFPIIYDAIKTILQAQTSTSAVERLFSVYQHIQPSKKIVSSLKILWHWCK